LRAIGVLAACFVVNGPSTTAAGTITFDNVVATWSDAQDGGAALSFAGNGTSDATVLWGVTVGGGQSAYNFTGLGAPLNVAVPPSPSADFVLGTLTHHNEPILRNTSITGIRLTIGADVSLDGSFLGTYNFVYDIAHDETPNGGEPCADGGANGVGVNANGCADNVRTTYNTLSDSFQIGPDLYTLDVRGFELLDQTHVLSFWTMESADTQSFLLARAVLTSDVTGIDAALRSTVTGIDAVPEPASLALFLTGLAGAAAFRRRRARSSR
jgi:hypothetical protein